MADSGQSESEFHKKLEEETASTLFELVWGTVKSAGRKLWTEVSIRTATHNYAVHYRERFGEVKVLGMTKPIPLHDIYTAVRTVSPQHLRAFTAVDEMEAAFKGKGRAEWQVHSEKIEDGIAVANSTRFLNILGAPGSGKSTFLRRLGQEAMLVRTGESAHAILSTNYRHSKLPVLIELRRFRQEPIDILEAIRREFVTCGFPDSLEFVSASLQQGRLLVLLDGLDEVPNDKLDEVIQVVKDFIDRYGGHDDEGNRFVMSCRTAHYKNFLPRFSDVVLADFSDEQIAKFAGNWFSSLTDRQQKTADRFLTRLKEPQHQQARELARTPLLLTFLCMTFQDRQDLPPTQATLYKTALEILLHKWAAERRVHNEPVYAELTAELEVDMLAEMAAQLFAEDRFFFNREQATGHIAKFMQNELNAPKSLDADQILNAIEVQQGLIVRRAQDAYSFSHLTIQEYLTARELWNAGPETWKATVRDHMFDHRWNVVFVLMAGMGKADELLLEMSQSIQQFWQESVREILWLGVVNRWLRNSFLDIEFAGGFSPQDMAACRCMALAFHLAVARIQMLLANETVRQHEALVFMVVRTLEFADALTHTFNSELTIVLEDGRVLDRGINSAFIRMRKVVNSISHVLLMSKTLNPSATQALRELVHENHLEFVNRFDLDFSDFSKLFTAWDLIIRCKNAAYRTTPGTWDEVCNRILR